MPGMANECIDAHHHLWRYQPEEYPWMGDGMEMLRRDYLTAELEEVTRSAGVTGTIVVQARQTMQETEWLSNLAARSDLIRGVVGWAPLASLDVGKELERLAVLPNMKGMRHALHDELDPFYMLRDDFNRGIGLLKHYGLRYDLLVFESHLPQTIEFVDRHPNQIFIVDHIAKPQIRDRALSPWKRELNELAQRSNVYCKVSGMVTEAKWDSWTAEELTPYFETVFEAFTPRRTMFGSDWPVITLASKYCSWVELVKRVICKFSPDEQERVLAGTAVEAYEL
jgi:L-fuconolactonase